MNSQQFQAVVQPSQNLELLELYYYRIALKQILKINALGVSLYLQFLPFHFIFLLSLLNVFFL